MELKLKSLLKNISGYTLRGSKDIEITGITANSKLVAPGNLFVAKKSGVRFIPEAAAAGAAAIVTDVYDPFLENVVQVIHPNVEEIEPELANTFYDNPAEKLFIIGITGTNGKTTTSYLVKHLLDPCGLIGTVEWIVGKTILPSTHTTPDLITNTKLFHDMLVQGCNSVVMEVSSHALDQGRVRTIPFDAAIFTNLTLDHLDYHQTMENYAAAKAKLFETLEGIAIYNIDDPWHKAVLQNCSAKKLSYGFGPEAFVRASKCTLSPQGMEFHVLHEGKEVLFRSTLIGRFNVYNQLAAVCVGLHRGMPLEEIAQSLSRFRHVPGRLERVDNARRLNIFVDYAHTDDALKNVLETLSELKKARLITVFGCGGNRDASKRPKMAAVAEKYCDFVIVTNDNPRNEDPEEIARHIISGFQSKSRFVVELDREAAIRKAIEMANPEDIILIAGKGHETYQIFPNVTLPFDDRLIARQSCL